jgi:ribosomal subunit interface protein
MLGLEIAARDVELSESTERLIRERAAKLETYHDRVMRCRIAVERPHRRGHTGSSYIVRLSVTVPGSEFVVKRKPRDTLLTAVQDAFDAAERRLRRVAERHRGEVKRHESQPHACVKELYPLAGYGHLETTDGQSVYFDAHSVLDGGFSRLTVGTPVRFVEGTGEKGPRASSVFPLRR